VPKGHRLTQKVLEEAEVALLIDTDTFFHCSPLELFRRVQPGTLLCNAFGLKTSLQDHELKRWLDHPLIRLVLGEGGEAIHAHLMQAKGN